VAPFPRRYLTEPADMLPHLEDQICRAFDRVSWEKDFTLIEGTGHAGVGRVFDLSNARVAQLLHAKAVIVCPGGIGRPIDEVALNKALFDKAGVEVVGAIINKVDIDKAAQIRDYVGAGLERLGVPLLGMLPSQKVLASPNLRQIAAEIKARWLNAEQGADSVRVNQLVVGAMTAKSMVDHLCPGTVIITPGDRDDILLAAISGAQKSPRETVAGVILTNDIKPHAKLHELLGQTQIPVMLAQGDSFTVTSKIDSMTVKTQPNDQDKIPVIKEMIQQHVDMPTLLGAI